MKRLFNPAALVFLVIAGFLLIVAVSDSGDEDQSAIEISQKSSTTQQLQTDATSTASTSPAVAAQSSDEDPLVQTADPLVYLTTESRCVALEISDDPDERRQGLSGRSGLAVDEGMIFLYEGSTGNRDPENLGFWMRDMNFAIDIIWLDESNRVVGIKENATPESYPESFYPEESAKKVVETVAGFAESQNINFGDELTLSDPARNRPASCE